MPPFWAGWQAMLEASDDWGILRKAWSRAECQTWASPLAHGCCGATPVRAALAADSRRSAGIAKLAAL